MDTNPRLTRILEKVRPKTFFEDLAEYGYLRQYINEFMKQEYDTNEEFKLKIFKILYKYSKYPDKDLNQYYMYHLDKVLNVFTNKVAD